MKPEVLDDAAGAAARAASCVAGCAREAVAARGGFALALSGGRTPWMMLRALVREDVPWPALQLFQVDERVAPAGDPRRNWTHVEEHLLRHVDLPSTQLHPMPVGAADLAAAAASYQHEIESVTGAPAVLDLVHLGLGEDGHTASLIPDDPVLDVCDADVALAGPHQGTHRMTLTYPALDRARRILWLVTGASKAAMLQRLEQGDRGIPAGRVRRDAAWTIVDDAAARGTVEQRS